MDTKVKNNRVQKRNTLILTEEIVLYENLNFLCSWNVDILLLPESMREGWNNGKYDKIKNEIMITMTPGHSKIAFYDVYNNQS